MSTDPKNLMNSCLEIEGLLSLLIQRGYKVPDHLYSLLQDKAEYLLAGINELQPSSEQKHVPTETETEIAESAGFEEEQDADSNPEAIQVVASESEDDSAEMESEVEEAEKDVETEQAEMPMSSGEVEDNIAEESAEEKVELEVSEAEVEEEGNKTPASEAKKVQPLKFSLNDKYRFRRELFNFSDEEMEEAIEAVSDMNSVEEVEDYFYNDLCWDPEDENARDFIAIVSSRF